jgi:putative transposase
MLAMTRRRRVTPAGIPQHVIQRGNNRHVCFAQEADMKAYIAWLRDYAQAFCVDIHAWVLMTNHSHLLCTPHSDDGISKMMQSLGRMYVSYFNYHYQRTGTLWEGRFKSCPIESEKHLLDVYRYIEMNPVRAGMVDDPADYSWSSYQCNALGKGSSLLTPHQIYTGLGETKLQRQSNYRNLFSQLLDKTLVDNIRNCTNSGLALGSDKFKAEIEALTGVRVSKGKRGRPIQYEK